MIAFIRVRLPSVFQDGESAGVQDGLALNDLEPYMVGTMSASLHVVLAQHKARRFKGSNDVHH